MRLAVYTTIYPGVEPYLADWWHSLLAQSDTDFDLWIGLDSLSVKSVKPMLGTDLEANWVEAPLGATPAEIRQQALAQIVECYEGVILVDSDDRMHPSRVAAARASLEISELAGCALNLIDQHGANLAIRFDLPQEMKPADVFPRHNIFGFSNSAFRSNILRRCLPIPAEAVLVDWFLATRAWLLGAGLSFDHAARMDYRQHAANTARVRSPFDPRQVVSDAALVRRHFQLLLPAPTADFVAARWAAVQEIAAEVEAFQERIVCQPDQLDEYVRALNATKPPGIWWSCVAYPELSHMWHSFQR